MKLSTLLLFLATLSLTAFAGGPDIESKDLTVGQIITTEDEIIMQIDGTFKIFTLRTPDEDHSDGGNAKMVPLVIRDGILRIPRKKWKHAGGDEYEVYLDWDQYKEDIMKWEGKNIMTQMWSTETVFRGGAPREIIAEVCKIWDRPQKENAAHAEPLLEEKNVFEIAITSEGLITRGDPTSLKELEQTLTGLPSDAKVLIRAEPSVSHKEVFSVMEICTKANLKHVALATTEAEQVGAGQPATPSESDSEGSDKPQPEAEGRSR